MQDKIQEIMGLVDEYRDTDKKCGSYTYNATTANARALLQSKLRELVRDPLTPKQRMEILHFIPDDDDADSEWMLTDMQLQLIMDGVERAHGITKTSN